MTIGGGEQFQLELLTARQEGDDDVRFSEMHSPSGHLNGEVRSALQKDIRRGNEENALYWASELDLGGYGKYLWKTLKIIASEDIGIAEPELPAQIRALYENWLDTRADEGKEYNPATSYGMLYVMHAVILMCRARKSRIVDNACALFYVAPKEQVWREIPDYALDNHTARGRRMGRTAANSFEETTRLENCHLDDPYLERSRALDEPEKNDVVADPAKAREKADRNKLLGALHIAYGGNGEPKEEVRARALAMASKQFGRQITSSAQLTNEEARWLLDALTKARTPAEKARARNERKTARREQ